MAHAPPPDAADLEEVLAALATLSRRPGPGSRRHLEAAVRSRRCISLVDPLLEAVRTDPRIHGGTLHTEIRKLVRESHWREAVKLAIALLGLFRDADDAPVAETLGAHEEFTLWAVVALGNLLSDPVPAWMHLAAQTRGWGKVHAVRRLVRYAGRPEVRHWLLRYGCANRIAANLTALDIAQSCKLHEALAEPDPGDLVLEGARHILNGLLEHGLAPGMASYADGCAAARLWVRAVAGRPVRLPEFLTLTALLHWVDRPGHAWPELEARTLAEQLRQQIGNPAYADLAVTDLEHPDPVRAWTAREVARRLGLPVFHRLMPLLRANPEDDALWTYVTAAATPDQLAQLPELVPGGNPEVTATLLRALRRAPGLGAEFLEAALADGAAAIRMLALDVLARWPVARVTPPLALAVMNLMRDDPEGVVRKSARGVLKGWKMPLTPNM